MDDCHGLVMDDWTLLFLSYCQARVPGLTSHILNGQTSQRETQIS